MFDVNKAIYACDDVICRNIESFTTEQRGLLSQNILSQFCREYFCESLHFFGWRTSKEGL